MNMSRLLVAAAVLAAAGCTDPVEPVLDAAGELQVRPGLVRMIAGETVSLEAVGFDANGEAVSAGRVTWTSLDEGIAAVNTNGVVTGVSHGWARIVAQAEGASKRDTAVVAVGLKLAKVASGDVVACGLTEEGSAYCWGGRHADRYGVRGTGAAPAVWTPLPVAGSLRFQTIAPAETHTCALTPEGAVYCWGRVSGNPLGITSCPALDIYGCHTPVRVSIDGTYDHVATSQRSFSAATCASGESGTTCWGDWRIARPGGGCGGCPPALLSTNVVGAIALGTFHGCGLDEAGNAWCWGSNTRGQLGGNIPPALCGDIQCTRSTAAVAVNTPARFTDIVAGGYFTCGLTAQGAVHCWGDYDRYGGSQGAVMTPVQVGAGHTFTSLSAGAGNVCGITTADALYCWGDGAWSGALGVPLLDFGIITTEPREVAPGLRVTAVGAGGDMTCAITTDGATVCLGTETGTGQGIAVSPTPAPLPIAPPGPLPDYLGIPEFLTTTSISAGAIRQDAGTLSHRNTR